MHAEVVLNVGAGTVSSDASREEVRRVAEAFARAGVDAHVQGVAAEEMSEAVRAAVASAADVVVVGGGDGTISTAAGILVETETPLGVLPLGTLNHFAKDLGIPDDLDGAVRTIAHANVRRVDLGEVNGRVFINNSSIGLYPTLVSEREQQQARTGWGKWRAMLHAAMVSLRRFRLWRVGLHANGTDTLLSTPFVFVGNNRYEMKLFSPGVRPALDRGELSLYYARNTRRFGLLRLFLHVLTGRLDQAHDFHASTVEGVILETGRRGMRVAVDGEVLQMQPPLRYRTRPGALRVIGPPAA